MRTLILMLAALGVAAPLSAQTKESDPDRKVAGGGALPTGWQARLDRASAGLENVKFVTMGDGYHATLGPAAVFYHPSHTGTGEYTARATYTQTKPARHPEAYGVFVGGRSLDAATQEYLYFVIRQTGEFLVKHRAGAETHTLIDWTEHAAIRKPDASGKATNALAIDVGARELRFLVNGTEVAKLERAASMNTDGIVGLRVNHNLDVHIGGFGVGPKLDR